MHLSEKIKTFNYCPACGSSDVIFDDKKEIEDMIVINPLEIPDDRIAFESIKMGLGIFKSSKSHVKHEAQ